MLALDPRTQGTCRHTLNNGIDWAALLAESAVDALGHVDIIACGPPATVHALFGLDCDGLCRANGFAELASNATLLTGRVPSQGMFASEAGRNRALLEWVEDGVSSETSDYRIATR